MRKLILALLLSWVVESTAQVTRSVVVDTNAFLTVNKVPFAASDTRVADSPITRIDSTTAEVQNIENPGNLIKGITTLTGTNTTTDWNISDRFFYSLSASSTNTHTNVFTSSSDSKSILITVSSDGTRTLDFVFGGGVTTNWVSKFVRTPRNGQTDFSFSNRGATIDIIAAPDVYATADNQILGRASGVLQFAAPSTFGIAAGSSLYDNTLVTVSNTVTETAIYTNSTAIAANALGTNKQAILIINGDLLQNTGAGNSNFTFRAYVGTTMVADGAIAIANAANRSQVSLELVVAAINSTAVQRSWFSTRRGGAGASGGTLSTAAILNGPVMGSTATDSTIDIPLSITVTPQHAVGTMVFDKYTAILTLP